MPSTSSNVPSTSSNVPSTSSKTRTLSSASQRVVGVSDLAVSNDGSARLITYALGSCIGLTAYDPVAKVGALLHFMLPKPPDDDAAEANPYMYATYAIPEMLKQMKAFGAVVDRMVFCAAGAAEILKDGGVFAIGQRNRTILRKILWRENLQLRAEATGGVLARTMKLDMATGGVTVEVVAEESVLWSR